MALTISTRPLVPSLIRQQEPRGRHWLYCRSQRRVWCWHRIGIGSVRAYGLASNRTPDIARLCRRSRVPPRGARSRFGVRRAGRASGTDGDRVGLIAHARLVARPPRSRRRAARWSALRDWPPGQAAADCRWGVLAAIGFGGRYARMWQLVEIAVIGAGAVGARDGIVVDRTQRAVPGDRCLTRQPAGHDRVFSAGTLIDSLRFRVHLAGRLRGTASRRPGDGGRRTRHLRSAVVVISIGERHSGP
jgi:hypothetical protein